MEVYLACFPVQGNSSDDSSGDGAFYSVFTSDLGDSGNAL